MLTMAMHRYLQTMAGSGYEWTDQPSSRPSSLARVGLADFLKTYSGSLCAMCGTFAERGEIAHVVSCGPNKKGFYPGNLAWCCEDCNDIDAELWKVIPYDKIRHPELIPATWPSKSELEILGQDVRAEKKAGIAFKKRIRGI